MPHTNLNNELDLNSITKRQRQKLKSGKFRSDIISFYSISFEEGTEMDRDIFNR